MVVNIGIGKSLRWEVLRVSVGDSGHCHMMRVVGQSFAPCRWLQDTGGSLMAASILGFWLACILMHAPDPIFLVVYCSVLALFLLVVAIGISLKAAISVPWPGTAFIFFLFVGSDFGGNVLVKWDLPPVSKRLGCPKGSLSLLINSMGTSVRRTGLPSHTSPQ